MSRRGWHFYRAATIGLAASLALLWIVATAAMAAPLRDVAPDDAGLYIELRGLAHQIERFQQSPLLAQWQRHPLWFPLAGKFQAESRRVSDFLGLSTSELWLDLLGDEALVAIWPGEKIREPGAALVMVRTSRHALLDRAIRRIAEETGRRDQSRQEHVIGGVKLVIHTVRPGQDKPAVQYTVLPGEGMRPSLCVVTSRPGTLETVLRSVTERGVVTETAWDGPVVRVTLCPRPWDALIRSAPQEADPRGQRGREVVEQTWQALEQGEIAVSLHSELRVETTLGWDETKLPAPMRELIASVSGKTRAADRVTDEALVAVGGRLDLGRVLHTVLWTDGNVPSLLKPGAPSFGSALALSVLGGLGPEWCGYLLPAHRSGDGAPPWPVDWLAGVDTQSLGSDSGSPKLGESMTPLLRQSLQFAEQAERSRDPKTNVRVETSTSGSLQITTVRGVPQFGPDGLVAFTQSAGTIWASSSSQRVQQAAEGTNAATLAAKLQRLEEINDPKKPASHLLFVDLAGLRRLLTQSPQSIERLAALRHISPEQAQRDWNGLIRVIEIGDRALLVGRVSATGMQWSATLAAEGR